MNRATDQQPRPGVWLALTAILFGVLALGSSGCEKKSSSRQSLGGAKSTEASRDERPADPEPSEHVETPEPEPVALATSRENDRNSLEGLDLDEAVDFPAINAPSSRAIAETVAALAGAIARGDARALHPMLDEPSQVILDQLVESDSWNDATGSITKVRVCTLEEDGSNIRVGLGVESASGAYLLGWEGERLGSGWLFAGIALETPVGADTAAQLDGSSLVARLVPEPGEIIDDKFDPTINDPRREENNRRRGKRRSGGGGRRGLR